MRNLYLLLLFLTLLTACKKEPIQQPINAFYTQMNTIMKSDYFWAEYAEKQIDGLDPYQYSPSAYLERLKSPEDRFSFILTRSEAAIFDGTPMDIGLLLRYLNDTAYVAYVEPNSPAHMAGLSRGMWVKSFRYTPSDSDSKTILTPASRGTSSYVFSKNVQIDVANKGKNQLRTITLIRTTYLTNAIGPIKTFTVGGKSVAYVHVSSFLGIDTSNQLKALFSEYKTKGIKDIIIDFRYNLGGYVSQSQLLASLIHHPGDDKAFCRTEYGPRTGKASYSYPFIEKEASIQATRCLFLVDGRTASASELVINSFKGLSGIEIKLIGQRTVGKNVGSSGYLLPSNNNYTHVLFPITFRSANHAGDSDYGGGFKPDYGTIDDVRLPLGDPNAPRLKAALYYLQHGQFPTPVAYASREAARPQTFIDTRTQGRIPLSIHSAQPSKPK